MISDESHWPYSAAVSPNGALVASGHSNGVIRLIGADGTYQTALSEHSDRVESIAWSPDSSHFASASADATVRIWKKDGTVSPVLNGHTGTVIKVAWSPDGQWLATGSNDKSVRLWQPDGSPGPVFNGHTDAVFAVAWSPDSRQVVSASLDRSARVWNVDGEAGPVIASAGRALLAIDWSPDGKQIATGSTDGFIRVYPTDGKTPKPYSINPKTSTYCNDVEWNHNGSLLASAHGDASVRLWNPNGSPAGKVQTRGEAKALNWSADGQRIAIANFARTVSLYNAETRQPVWTAVPLDEGKAVILSPNGQLLHGDSETLEDKLVYIVEHNDGQLVTLKLSDFDKHTSPAAAKENSPTESTTTGRNH